MGIFRKLAWFFRGVACAVALAAHAAQAQTRLPEVEAPSVPVSGPTHLTAPAPDPRLQWLESNQARLERLLESDEQDAPGAEQDDALDEFYRPLPAYVYEESYFDTPYVGARALADYAPPGYEPREQQDAPGVPEFRRIYPPLEITEFQRDHFVTRGLYPGSFLVPGTATSVRLRGFVRLTSMYDFQPIGSPDAFVTNTIPVPQQVGENFNMTGRISRFALETWTPTDFHEWNVHTFIEGDFFNGPGQAAGGGGNPFRLRNAFIDFGYFRLGQQNSVFMDGQNWPSLVDFQGPNSWTNQRQPTARATVPLGERLYWAGSMERCFSDITTNGLGAGYQNVPDFATHLRYEATRGHLQISGLLREIGFRPNVGDEQHETASAVSASAVCHPWAILFDTDPLDRCASGWTRSRLLGQYTTGRGVGRYLNDLAGQGLDAQVNPLTGELQLVNATGWNASYEHWYNEHWLSNFTYAHLWVDDNPDQPPTTYESATYQAASLWWIPIPRLSLGIEFLWGDRRNLNGQVGDAERLNALVQYNF